MLIFARDKHESAAFLASILGLAAPRPAGFFVALDLDNAVTVHFGEPGVEFLMQHYAFLVSEPEFDAVLARLQERKLTYWADPQMRLAQQINTHHGGRGVYFLDPSGHGMEVITQPYPLEIGLGRAHPERARPERTPSNGPARPLYDRSVD